ncbi:Methionine aminopeptidase, type II, partial [Phytophthora palmivora]
MAKLEEQEAATTTPDVEEDVKMADAEHSGAATEGSKSKKKKKKSKKKKNKTAGSKLPPFRGVSGFTDSYVGVGQTEPPTIPIEKLFPDGKFPVGEIQDHPGDFNTFQDERNGCFTEVLTFCYKRQQMAEICELNADTSSCINFLTFLLSLPLCVCPELENKNRELVVEAGFARGIGFPTGCSLNHVAAHYTPNSGYETAPSYADVMKV